MHNATREVTWVAPGDAAVALATALDRSISRVLLRIGAHLAMFHRCFVVVGHSERGVDGGPHVLLAIASGFLTHNRICNV